MDDWKYPKKKSKYDKNNYNRHEFYHLIRKDRETTELDYRHKDDMKEYEDGNITE